MKKIFLLVLMASTLIACHENLDERAQREAQEFTKKTCPMKISEGVVIDSMTFDKSSKTVRYMYTLSGKMDTTITEEISKEVEKQMLEDLRNSPHLKIYKEAGYQFRYTFFSTKQPRHLILDYMFSPEQYNENLKEKSNSGSNGYDVVDESNASIISEVFIKNFMKFPDDVKFDSYKNKVINKTGNVFKITGKVKANNLYGQAIPYIYNVRIRYNGGEWNKFLGERPVNWTFMGGNIYSEATNEFIELNSQE